MTDLADRTRELRRLLAEASPLIEEYTRQVCPVCTDVCCRQKHGTFTPADRAYIGSLGTVVPLHDPDRDPDGPCQFLGPGGCAKPRWQRAWKCTWYFCRPLLDALNAGPAKRARQLSLMLERMGTLYGELQQAMFAEEAHLKG